MCNGNLCAAMHGHAGYNTEVAHYNGHVCKAIALRGTFMQPRGTVNYAQEFPIGATRVLIVKGPSSTL